MIDQNNEDASRDTDIALGLLAHATVSLSRPAVAQTRNSCCKGNSLMLRSIASDLADVKAYVRLSMRERCMRERANSCGP